MDQDVEDDGDARPQAEENGANNFGAQRQKGRRARMNLDIPPVRDATGEKVMESFELFLKSSVPPSRPLSSPPSQFRLFKRVYNLGL